MTQIAVPMPPTASKVQIRETLLATIPSLSDTAMRLSRHGRDIVVTLPDVEPDDAMAARITDAVSSHRTVVYAPPGLRRMVFAVPHHALKLTHELIAAIAEIQPVLGPDGLLQSVIPPPESNGAAYTICVPEGVNPARVQQIVAAHDPTPPPVPPDPDVELLAAIAQAQAQAAAATTVAGMRGAFDALCNALSGKIRPGRVAGRPV